jgi:hypothetical protein
MTPKFKLFKATQLGIILLAVTTSCERESIEDDTSTVLDQTRR